MITSDAIRMKIQALFNIVMMMLGVSQHTLRWCERIDGSDTYQGDVVEPKIARASHTNNSIVSPSALLRQSRISASVDGAGVSERLRPTMRPCVEGKGLWMWVMTKRY